MRIFSKKIDLTALSICALSLGPCINFYLNDIIQYAYGGSSISAPVYILLALIGISSYSFLSKKKTMTRMALITALFVFLSLLISVIIHPSLSEIVLTSDYNPLESKSLFLILYGFPLMILCSLDNDWDTLLKYLYYFSIIDIVLAVLDYNLVMLRISYDTVNYMTFSYNQLFAASVCAVFGYKEKKVIPFLFSILSLVLIFFGGARGTLGCLLILYLMLFAYPFTAKRFFIILGVGTILLFIAPILLNKFIFSASNIIDEIGGFSRTLYKLTEGELLDSSGRNEISRVIKDAIWSNPLGYGVLGDRYVLMQHGSVGYAHNVFLEFICDYGWLLGLALFLTWIVYIVKIFFNKNNSKSYYCFLAMVPSGCLMLFMSGSFMEEFVFWALLGLIFNWWTLSHRQMVQS